MYTQVCEHRQPFEVTDTLLTTNSQETLQDEVSSANEIEVGRQDSVRKTRICKCHLKAMNVDPS